MTVASVDIAEHRPAPISRRAALVVTVAVKEVLASSADWWYPQLPAELLRLPHAAPVADSAGRRAEPVQLHVNGLPAAFRPPHHGGTWPRAMLSVAATAGGQHSKFTFDPTVNAALSGIEPTHGLAGATLTVRGSAFHARDGGWRVTIGGEPCGAVERVSDAELACTVVEGQSGAVRVVLGSQGEAAWPAAATS